MAKKSTKSKKSKKTESDIAKSSLDPNKLIDDIPGIVPSKVTNRQILEKLIDMERRLVRVEKLILLMADDQFFTREEKAKVEIVEQMVREGRFEELEAMMKNNKL